MRDEPKSNPYVEANAVTRIKTVVACAASVPHVRSIASAAT
ncbi:MAG TPA: hypothetical protein VN905_08890 [Candidatus Binatia bacterium]|nr:hypothetical protein [Candidatus Binatia bacterium]